MLSAKTLPLRPENTAYIGSRLVTRANNWASQGPARGQQERVHSRARQGRNAGVGNFVFALAFAAKPQAQSSSARDRDMAAGRTSPGGIGTPPWGAKNQKPSHETPAPAPLATKQIFIKKITAGSGVNGARDP